MSKEVVRIEKNYSREAVGIYQTEQPNAEASFAMNLIKEWGMVMGKPDGEDSAGRTRIARMPIEEVIELAFKTSDVVFAETRKRGWMLELPLPRSESEIAAENEAIDQAKGDLLPANGVSYQRSALK